MMTGAEKAGNKKIKKTPSAPKGEQGLIGKLI
jgi:hypothetical protein